jgi:hypothetical protein
MSIGSLLGDQNPADQNLVELMTLRGDVTIGSPRPFPDLVSALAYVRQMSLEEQEASWIRIGAEIFNLEDAKRQLEDPGRTPEPDGV